MEALKLLKQLFTKQTFADAKLMDGTIVSAESFEPGQPLFIVDEAGERIPAPEGEHIMEDGTKVMVKEGVIESIVEKEEIDIFEIGEDSPVEEEMAIEIEVEPYVEEVPEKEDEIAMLRTMCEEMASKIKIMEEEMGKMKMANEESTKTIADAVVELSENFSKIPAAEKLEVNPQDFSSKFSKITKKEKKQSVIDWLATNKK